MGAVAVMEARIGVKKSVYRKFWICPQHLSMLLHEPKSLIGKLRVAKS